MKDDMYYAKKLSEMIKVETVSEPNNPNTEKFDKFHEKLRELFPLVFSRLSVTYIDSSILIKWKGQGKEKPILFMSHQDTVSASGDWKEAPFSGLIKDGRIWGRGTVDTKGSLMCIFQSFEELLEEGYVPNRDLYIASSSTEEIAGSGAPKTVDYLKQQGVKLEFLMDEGGMIVDEPMPGVNGRFAMIGTVEKGTGNIVVSASSTGGHASAPGKNTALVRIAKFICDIEKDNPNIVKFSPTLLEMFKRLGKNTSGALGFFMRHAKALSPILKRILPSVSPKAAAMVRTTMAFTMCGGSNGKNVLPEKAWVNINTRFIEHQGVEKTKRIFEPYLKKYNLSADYSGCKEPQKSVDYKAKPFCLVEETVKKVYPTVNSTPYIMTGGTDAYFYSPVTDNAIRFAPLYIDKQQLESIHGLNENIYVSSLSKGVEFYKTIIQNA